jgi:hypothetical protein
MLPEMPIEIAVREPDSQQSQRHPQPAAICSSQLTSQRTLPKFVMACANVTHSIHTDTVCKFHESHRSLGMICCYMPAVFKPKFAKGVGPQRRTPGQGGIFTLEDL